METIKERLAELTDKLTAQKSVKNDLYTQETVKVVAIEAEIKKVKDGLFYIHTPCEDNKCCFFWRETKGGGFDDFSRYTDTHKHSRCHLKVSIDLPNKPVKESGKKKDSGNSLARFMEGGNTVLHKIQPGPNCPGTGYHKFVKVD